MLAARLSGTQYVVSLASRRSSPPNTPVPCEHTPARIAHAPVASGPVLGEAGPERCADRIPADRREDREQGHGCRAGDHLLLDEIAPPGGAIAL
jgi:hypothetical protein